MNVLYEDGSQFKVGHVLAEQGTTLQVEHGTGKRSKIKSSAVLLRFDSALQALLPAAEELAATFDIDFLWEVAPEEEFHIIDFSREFFGQTPTSIETAALTLSVHRASLYFHRRGKGQYRRAPAEILKAALLGAEKKRLQAAEIAEMAASLSVGKVHQRLQAAIRPLLYRPDKNSIEYRAVEQAMQLSGKSLLQLLREAGSLSSHQGYHTDAFLFNYFPDNTDFPENAEQPLLPLAPLPLAEVHAFSIDDASTTEIDDAFSVSFQNDGTARIGIHIAAPALGIAPNSALDTLVKERLSTVYAPGQKILMLPPQVIEQFTLKAGYDCPAVSLYLNVDLIADYTCTIIDTRIERVPIVDNLRHDTLERYFNEAALKNADPTPYPHREALQLLWELTNRLERKRSGSETTPTTSATPRMDYQFVVQETAEGSRIALVARQRGSPIDRVVSELMILVNSYWGEWLAQHQVPAIYRAQTGGKVRMTTQPEPHQGLGVPQYAWSSSPLRRAIDLINQRQLIAALTQNPLPYPDPQSLFPVLRDFEQTYPAYLAFQNRMENYWCLRYLEQQQIEEISATVLRDNAYAQLEGIPLIVKPEGLPQNATGTRVLLQILSLDYWQIQCRCRMISLLDPVEPTTTAAA